MAKSLKRFPTRYSLILGEHGANELEVHVLTSHEHFADLKNILCSLKKLESILPSGNWITQKDSRMDWLLIYIVFLCPIFPWSQSTLGISKEELPPWSSQALVLLPWETPCGWIVPPLPPMNTLLISPKQKYSSICRFSGNVCQAQLLSYPALAVNIPFCLLYQKQVLWGTCLLIFS